MNSALDLLKKLKSAWMKFAFVLGTINSYILLTLFYFFILGIYAVFAFIYRIFIRGGLLKKESYWKDRQIILPTLENLQKIF